jgi:hypothetical protein
VKVLLRDIAVPEFGLPTQAPQIPASVYEDRCAAAYAAAKCDWLVVYADREHLANIAFLSGYEPRFEEALLLLGPNNTRILVVGNEGEGYAPVAALPNLDVVLAQTMSLMGQTRASRPKVESVLRSAGVKTGQMIGLVGWKYLEPFEWDDQSSPGFFVPHYLVQVLARIAGGVEAIADVTPVLMHPTRGLRSTIDADQIALHEWGASRASAAVWRVLHGVRIGDPELFAARAMGYCGEILSAHVMLTSGNANEPIVGMRSPGGRNLALGDGVTTAIGYWGGLSCRAGLLAYYDDSFLQLASAYFAGLAAWYEAADIGVSGQFVFQAVSDALARGGLRSALNPGHLTGHDEWIHTPIRSNSAEIIASGMPFQVDLIPAPLRPGWALNCEDGIVFASAASGAELRARHPEVSERIDLRRKYMREQLGIEVKDSVLPLSTTPMSLPPFWLAPHKLLARG